MHYIFYTNQQLGILLRYFKYADIAQFSPYHFFSLKPDKDEKVFDSARFSSHVFF